MKQSTTFAQVATNLLNVLQGYTKTIRLLLVMFLTLTVSAEVWGADFEKYSGTITEGDYLIVYDNGAMKNTVSGERLQYTTVTVSNNKISNPDASLIWHIAPNGSYWTIYNANVSKYAAGTGVKNKAQLLTSGTDDKSLWTVSGTSTYEFVNKANKAASVNSNLRRNGTYGFACYSTSTGGALTLYKKVATNFSVTAQSNNINYGTVSLSGTTITASPKTGYRVSTTTPYTISPSGSATVTQSENKFTVTPTANCTITINFEALPKYIVTLVPGSGSVSSTTLTESSAGAGVSLPTPTLDCGDWEFAGWTTSSVATETTSKPEILLTGTYSPSTDITLYAVYKRIETTEGAGTTEVTKIVSISDYASAKSWNNDNRYTTVNIDANITATASSDPATNTGKYYSNDNSWRFYQNETGKLTITANEGITLKSITLTFTNKDYGTISYNSNSCTSNTAISVSGQSATFTVGSSSGSKGKIFITKISVTYESTSGSGSTIYYHSTPECAAPCTDPSLAYAIASVTKTVGDAAFTNPLTNNKNVSVTYTSTNTSVATVDNNGQVKIKAVGETTIKATWAGNADYCADEASYTLTVLPKTYTITVANNISNGSVSADKSSAVEGATIKLTATPNTGYKLGTWNIKDASNNPVSVNENGEFTMPASNVTVSATFVSLPKLATPSNLSATEINPTSATLSWTKVENKKEYKVTITDDHDYTETFTVTDETKSVSSLSPNTTYYWTVKAIGDGTSYSDSDAAEHTFTTTAASTPEPGTGGEEGEYVWKLVENVSELHNLDEVIITASGEINYALSTEQKPSNRGATPITKEGKLLKDPSGEVQIITLVETGSADVFGFNTGSGHLYAASSSGNQLKTKSSLDEHGKWTITISEGVASIVATASTNRNVMQYNPNNSGSPLFACYSSASQTSLAIYKKVTSTDEPDTPTPDKEYISGKWKLVDATSKLQAGMEIIIASVAEEGTIKTMAEQRDNNRGAVASVLDGENLKPAVGTTLITLEDCQLYEDLFALKTKDGYLYAAASGNNHLKSRDGINDHACWEIAIADGVASAKATKSSYRNVLQYNPNNGAPLFSCYAFASQKPITIYSKVYDVTATAENGSVSGTGTYYQGNSVTLKATADFDYEFVNWTVDGEVVSTDNPYKFQVTADVELVAKFQEIAPTTEALSGKFSTGKYEYAEFATGNLQYKPSTDSWRFAKQQYQYVGKDNIYVGKEDYKGWIDLFGWSADNKFGVNPSNDNTNYQGEFVDWGKLFPEEGWSTLSKNQWHYLLNQRTNAASLKQIAMVGETLGIMLFPDEWTLPAGCAPTQQTHHDEEDGEDHSCDFVSYNYTLAHWTELEKAGAIFLPAAGRRTGGWGNKTISPHMIGKAELDADDHYKHYADYYAYYWTSTKTDGKVNYLINCTLVDKVKDTYTVHAGHVNWAEEARYGQSVRLAKVTNTLIQLGSDDNSTVIAANEDKTVNVKVNRTFKANDGYYTICLPFNIDADEIGTAYQIKEITEHVAGEGINVEFTEVTTLTAGQPYLLLPSKNLENPIFEGVTIVNTTGKTTEPVVGAGIKITFTGIINGVGETTGSTDYYVGDNGFLYNGTTEKLGLRAFFTITDEAGNPAKVRARVVVGENTATDLDNILNGENTTIKVIKNGQLIIIRNGEKFNAQGQKL